MAKRALLLAIPMALLLGMGTIRAEQNSLPGMVQLEDKSGRLCGTPLIAGQEQLLLENTRRISPDLPAALAKESQTQHEVGDTLSFVTINFQKLYLRNNPGGVPEEIGTDLYFCGRGGPHRRSCEHRRR